MTKERKKKKPAVTSLDAGSAGAAASRNGETGIEETHKAYGAAPTRSQVTAYHPLFPSSTPKKTEEEGAGEDEGEVEAEDGGEEVRDGAVVGDEGFEEVRGESLEVLCGGGVDAVAVLGKGGYG